MATLKQKRAVKKILRKFEKYEGTFLYLLRCQKYYKIGIAFNLEGRLVNIQCGNPFPVELVWAVKIGDAKYCEGLLHTRYADKRVSGEWFELGSSEVGEIINLTANLK